ncbi:MAG: hypothetical protein Q4G22_01700 [Paracoccus sp. (in: a-proteobacteria)]|uniref:hypothetical protein n=1 Tax=Paracoccus sp. TaxID=267 RepID=UPI0026E0CF7A|nr:hypothetical protein [Paracoccus sp. (in: a-proteobacteria)]MDO5630530.1 hypothetical protein [Paracoccus sp. (in: a-proteobacteria)]
MRLSEIADRLAELEGRDADEIHIRLRNPLFKGLLTGEPGRTRNSPADYPFRELIRARLLLAMFDCGLSTAELALVSDMLNDRYGVTGPGGAAVETNPLNMMTDGTAAGESWFVTIRFVRGMNGERIVTPLFFKDGSASVRDVVSHGGAKATHLMTSIVPASDLIRPLLPESSE